MQKRRQIGLLVCFALILVMSQTLWGQFAIKVSGTDGSGITDTLTLAVNAAGTAGFDSLSPTLHEYEIPVPAKGLDFRVAANAPADNLGAGSYTSIHHLAFPTQLDVWRMQFNVDDGRTSFLIQWPAGLSGVGGGFWKLKADTNDAITFADVDMTTSTSYSIPVADVEQHHFFIVAGDSQKYRSFTSSEIALAHDSKSKPGKSEARKAVGAQGTYTFTHNLAHPYDITLTDLHIEWNEGIGPPPSISIGSAQPTFSDAPKNTKLDIHFPDSIHPSQSVSIFAIAVKGKLLQAKKWYWVNAGAAFPHGVKNAPVDAPDGLLRYNMPNINNMGEEAYSQVVFTGGLTIGNITDPVPGLTDAHGKTEIKGVVHGKWKDVLKSLSDKTGLHTAGPSCLDFFGGVARDLTKPIEKAQKSLPPAKHSNKLFAEAIALKCNIGFGEAGKIVEGGTTFGHLLYVRQPGDPLVPPGTSVITIAQVLDSTMRCMHTSMDPAGPVDYTSWYNMIYRLNASFGNAPFDTAGFIKPVPPPHVKTAGTVATGTRAIGDVGFLYRTSYAENMQTYNPPDIAALEALHQPAQYKLMQNYPNPFNPTTTIEYAMPQDGYVTMKIYNILGQEVATLMDHELVDQGTNEVTFDATNLASGVYYYRMIVNDGQFQTIKKMMLIK